LHPFLDANEMINLLKKCDYVLTDVTSNTDHINGISMSGNIPLAFSTLTPLIISKTNNLLYKFKNVIEFDLNSDDKIIIEKGKIDVNLLVKERDELIKMFDNNISKVLNNTKIPKKIIQTWENKNFEPEFEKIIDSWKDNNPEYEYILFDNHERYTFIKDNFDENVLNTYESIIPGAFKADLFRYCYLYINGGVYIDIDTLCIGNLDNFLLANIDFVVPIDLNV
jgi:mannosyltransferase OCH1-like enzyme